MTPQLAWQDWQPMESRGARLQVSPLAGLYRVRVVGDDHLAYVGQTSGLRGRLGQLSRLYQEEMPYNDPHTAAPCLWVLRTAQGAAFEFSVAEFDVAKRTRQATECLVIAEHRRRFGCSPTANFGRMPSGWRKSTGNNAALVRTGRRRRGYADLSAARVSDHEPALDPHRSPVAPDWAGFAWSPWSSTLDAGTAVGVYRIQRAGEEALIYIGQGLVRNRLAAHAAKGRREFDRQHLAFRGVVRRSWVDLSSCATSQLLEVECDLIASHLVVTGSVPEAQFLG